GAPEWMRNTIKAQPIEICQTPFRDDTGHGPLYPRGDGPPLCPHARLHNSIPRCPMRTNLTIVPAANFKRRFASARGEIEQGADHIGEGTRVRATLTQ